MFLAILATWRNVSLAAHGVLSKVNVHGRFSSSVLALDHSGTSHVLMRVSWSRWMFTSCMRVTKRRERGNGGKRRKASRKPKGTRRELTQQHRPTQNTAEITSCRDVLSCVLHSRVQVLLSSDQVWVKLKPSMNEVWIWVERVNSNLPIFL
jgi:hypothetical protein